MNSQTFVSQWAKCPRVRTTHARWLKNKGAGELIENNTLGSEAAVFGLVYSIVTDIGKGVCQILDFIQLFPRVQTLPSILWQTIYHYKSVFILKCVRQLQVGCEERWAHGAKGSKLKPLEAKGIFRLLQVERIHFGCIPWLFHSFPKCTVKSLCLWGEFSCFVFEKSYSLCSEKQNNSLHQAVRGYTYSF